MISLIHIKKLCSHMLPPSNKSGRSCLCAHLCARINIQLTHQLHLSERKSWHGERPCPLSFGGMHRAYVSQDLIQTMIHPSRRSRTKSTRVESSCVEPRGRPGRRLQEWFESRPYTGGVVPSTYNYRKLASFCRAVSCPPFLIPRLTLAARASFVGRG